VREAVPNSRVEYAPGGGPDARSYRVDFDKIRRQLPAYKPKWTARQGAQQLYTAYRREAALDQNFEGPRFMRAAHIKQLIVDGRLDTSLRWTGTVE